MTADPMEAMISKALEAVGEPFITDHDPASPAGLDFYIPRLDVHIEVKRMHSPRISEQMSRADNVIVAQGEGAVRALARMVRSWQSPDVDQIKGYRDAYKDIAKNAAAQLEEAKAEIARLKAAFTPTQP